MELLPPTPLLRDKPLPLQQEQLEGLGGSGEGGAQVVARRLLEDGERQPRDTSLYRAAATGEERPKHFSSNELIQQVFIEHLS